MINRQTPLAMGIIQYPVTLQPFTQPTDKHGLAEITKGDQMAAN